MNDAAPSAVSGPTGNTETTITAETDTTAAAEAVGTSPRSHLEAVNASANGRGHREPKKTPRDRKRETTDTGNDKGCGEDPAATIARLQHQLAEAQSINAKLEAKAAKQDKAIKFRKFILDWPGLFLLSLNAL